MRIQMRVRWVVASVAVVLGGFGLSPVASAHEGPHKPTQATTPEGAVGIGDGIFLTAGSILPPAGEAPRTLDAYHTAAFVQSWLAAAFYGNPDAVNAPPAALPIYRVDSTGDWAGTSGTVTVYYATDGTTPYIAFPGMVVWTDASEVPPPSNWFVAPPRTIDAFNGVADLVESLGVETATSVATTEPRGEQGALANADSDATEAWPWALVGITAAAAIATGLWFRRRAPAG
jgi:hypothetical protein